MPIDPWIARGSAPIDITNTLAQIAQLKQRDRALQQDQQRNDQYQQRLDQEDQVRADARSAAEEQKQAEHLLAKTQWALRSPNPRLAVLGDPGIDPRAHDQFFQMSDEQVVAQLKQAEATYAAQLGKGPSEDGLKTGPIPLDKFTPQSIEAAKKSGSLADLVPLPDKPQQYAPQAPNRDVELATWWQKATPEQRAAYEATHPRSTSSDRPQIIPDPYGGDPMQISTDESGNVVRKPVPLAGAAPGPGGKPTINPAQAISEARAAMKKGLSRDEAIKRLKAAGIEPTGL